MSGSAGAFSVTGNHVYQDEGGYSIAVTLTDDSPGTTSVTATGDATVLEGDSFTAFPGTIHSTEGTDFTGVVAFFADNYKGNISVTSPPASTGATARPRAAT